jgi:hypothetical protein
MRLERTAPRPVLNRTVAENVHRPGQGEDTTIEQHQAPTFLPAPRYFVLSPGGLTSRIAVKDVTSTTNSRSVISCIIPAYAQVGLALSWPSTNRTVRSLPTSLERSPTVLSAMPIATMTLPISLRAFVLHQNFSERFWHGRTTEAQASILFEMRGGSLVVRTSCRHVGPTEFRKDLDVAPRPAAKIEYHEGAVTLKLVTARLTENGRVGSWRGPGFE